MGLKIRWKLLAFMAGFTLIVITLLWLLQTVFLDDIHRIIKVSETKEAAQELSRLAKTPLILEGEADEISKEYRVCIIAYRIDSSGTKNERILSCEALKDCAIHSFSDQQIIMLHIDTKNNDGKLLQYYSPNKNDGGGPKTIIYSFIATDTRGNDVFFVLNSFVTPLDSTARTLNYLLIIIGAVMVIMSVILTFVLSKTVTKPIADISDSAKKLAEGNYNICFDGGSYREINELADTLNYAASELSRVDTLRSELIANTSHDLRTPLTMITGYAEIMRDIEGENTPENAQIIIDESKRLTSLVNDMLEISKLENGSATLNYETFDITEAVSSELQKYGELCRREGYILRFEADSHITVTTDRSKLIRALLNLVNNALTYTGDDKTVTVKQDVYTSNRTNVLRLSVIDTGEGIPSDKLSLIWDRYYKLDSPHKRAAKGSGLGLSIVSKLMTLIGGRCGVVSSVGHGSIFWIELNI